MNARKAKQLRKEAHQVAKEKGITSYETYELKKYNKTAFDFMGNPIPYIVYTAMLKDCFKAEYRKMKQLNKKQLFEA